MTPGVRWSKCPPCRPTLIIGFWAMVAVAEVVWLFVLGGRLPA
jgi:hypothetical protein